MINTKDYLVGIIDGEGCIHSPKTSNTFGHRSVRISVQMSSREVCDLLKKEWGGHISKIKRLSGPYERQMWGWELGGVGSKTCLEYVAEHSITKKKQAVLALRIIGTISEGSSNQWGVRGIPDEVRDQREGLARQISLLNKGAI